MRKLIIVLWMILVAGLLNGCLDFCNGGPCATGLFHTPYLSNIAEDAAGNKYFISASVTNDVVSTTGTLFRWDASAQQWLKQTTFSQTNPWWDVSLFLHPSKPELWLNTHSSSGYGEPTPLKLDLQTMQISSFALGPNQTLVAADQAVEYQGYVVNWFEPSTGTSTYLHNLPTVSQVLQYLGIRNNTNPYMMLCAPATKYEQWDGTTHYCVLANDVQYETPTSTFSSLTNDEYKFTVSVDPTGFTYHIIQHQVDYFTSFFRGSELWPKIEIDFPQFTSVAQEANCIDTNTIDPNGNLHHFCTDSGNLSQFTYTFYDKTNPTVPMYAQTLAY